MMTYRTAAEAKRAAQARADELNREVVVQRLDARRYTVSVPSFALVHARVRPAGWVK